MHPYAVLFWLASNIHAAYSTLFKSTYPTKIHVSASSKHPKTRFKPRADAGFLYLVDLLRIPNFQNQSGGCTFTQILRISRFLDIPIKKTLDIQHYRGPFCFESL